jgi:DNA polymerase III epsilon subunit-like protein
MIINRWPAHFTARYGHFFPDSYFCWDTEYTGGNAELDLIVEIGHVIVEDRTVTNRLSLVLDWTRHPGISKTWLKQRLSNVAYQMQGDWRVTWDVMRSDGVDPVKGLQFYCDLFATWDRRGLPFAAHNGFYADERMFAAKHHPAVFKQAVTDWLPRSNDTLRSYFCRTSRKPLKGLKWRLGDCLRYYGLDEREDLELDDLHTAEFDAYCVHLLMEEYRSRITENHSDETGLESGAALQRLIEQQLAREQLTQEAAVAAKQSVAEVHVGREVRDRLRQRRRKQRPA